MRSVAPFLASALAATLLGVEVPAARAQFVPAPRDRAAANAAAAGSQAAARAGAAAGYRQGVYNASYLAPNPYTIETPASGYLHGGADVIRAQSEYLIGEQQAALTKEQVRQSKVDTRRRQFDEFHYERANTPTVEEERELARMQQVQRSRNNPPVTEIYSAKALNDLLVDLQKSAAPAFAGPMIPLNAAQLKQINVTSGTTAGNIGPLKSGGALQWPYELTGKEFATQREVIDRRLPQAVQQAMSGRVESDILRALTDAVDTLQRDLKAQVTKITPNDYISAKRYLNELDEAFKKLRDPNVANYYNGAYAAQGNTISELLQYMTSQGLRFAPANRGSEPAYLSLHRSLATFDTSLVQLTTRPQ